MEVNGEGGGQQVKKNAVVGMKEKKIPNEERSTTTYMTKYERARVLGTRALQIRYVVWVEEISDGWCVLADVVRKGNSAVLEQKMFERGRYPTSSGGLTCMEFTV